MCINFNFIYLFFEKKYVGETVNHKIKKRLVIELKQYALLSLFYLNFLAKEERKRRPTKSNDEEEEKDAAKSSNEEDNSDDLFPEDDEIKITSKSKRKKEQTTEGIFYFKAFSTV